TLLTFIVAGCLYFIVVNVSFLSPFEKAFSDFSFTDFYYANYSKNSHPSKDIIIVNIKDADRLEIATAIKNVVSQNSKAIGLDVIFRDLKDTNTDSILRNALQSHPNIVTAFYTDNGEVFTNHPYFINENETVGFIDFDYSSEKTVIRE